MIERAVRGLERRRHRIEAGRRERAGRHGGLDLVALAEIAHLGDAGDANIGLPHAGASQQGASLRLHLGEEPVERRPVGGVKTLAVSADEVERQWGRQQAVRRDGAGAEWQQDARHAQDARDLPAVDGTSAAEGEEGIAAEIAAALDAVDPCGRRHVLVDDAVDAPRRRDHVEAQRARDVFLDRTPRGLAVEPHAPAQEEFGVEVTEQEIGVGHGGEPAAQVVTGGPGIGARTVGADLEQAHAVDARDRATTGADLDHLDHRHSHGHPRALLEAIGAGDLELPCDQRRAVVDHARLGRGTAHVEREQARFPAIPRRPRGGDGAGGRARFHQADRKSPRLAWQHDAAGRLHDVELAGDVELREPSLEVFQVTRHQRHDVDVGRRRGCPLVFSDLGNDVGRARHRNARSDLGCQLGQAALVGRIHVRVEQADRDRLDAVGDEAGDHPSRARLVEVT